MSVHIIDRTIIGIKEDGEKIRIWEGKLIQRESDKLNYAIVIRYTVWPADNKIRIREVQIVMINDWKVKLSLKESTELIMKYMKDEVIKHDDPAFLVEIREKLLYQTTEEGDNIGDYLGIDILPIFEYLTSDEVCEYISNIILIGVELIPDSNSESGYRAVRHVVDKSSTDIKDIYEALKKIVNTCEEWEHFSERN